MAEGEQRKPQDPTGLEGARKVYNRTKELLEKRIASNEQPSSGQRQDNQKRELDRLAWKWRDLDPRRHDEMLYERRHRPELNPQQEPEQTRDL